MGLLDFLGIGRRERFAKQVVARLAERGWRYPARYDQESKKLVLGGDAWPVPIEAISQAFDSDTRKDRSAALDAALDFIFELPLEAPFERVKARLVPILRGRKVTEALQLDPPDDPRMALGANFRPFADYYVIQVAAETPAGFDPLPALAYERWGVTFDEALAAAMENLRARPTMPFKQLEPGLYGSYAEDGNDLARLLLPETFASIELKGAPVVVGAVREAVFLAGSEDPAGLEVMAMYAAEQVDGHRLPIALSPMILEGGAWRPFQAPDRPRRVKDLDLMQQAHDYEQERPLLDHRLRESDRPKGLYALQLFAAPGETVSLGFWRPVVGLVPKADQVVVDLGSHTIVRYWADVADALGFSLEPRTASPHYFATRSLDAAVREALQQAPEPEWAKGKGFSFSERELNVFG